VHVLPVDVRERVTQQRRAEAFALLRRVDAEEGEMRMRLFRMRRADLLEDGSQLGALRQ
jgi:hypothetical protein